jgi:hypothetical protein
MRERATAAAGSLTAEMRPEGQFVIEAVLPVKETATGHEAPTEGDSPTWVSRLKVRSQNDSLSGG